jgi:hypothetical protein
LIKDYDLGINYHPGKANVVVDALSRKKYCNTTFARRMPSELRREIEYLNLGMVNETRVVEGLEKATRGGVNGSQSKFLTGTWPMSQNQPEPLSSNSAKTA